MKLIGPTVLIVDDNPDDRFFIARALSRAGLGFSAQSVTSGEEAVAYLDGQGVYAERLLFPYPSLIITDLEMPGGDGFSVLRHLRRKPPAQSLPVLMLSSSDDPNHRRRAYQLGTTLYCVKPQSYTGLLPILSNFFNRPLARHGSVVPAVMRPEGHVLAQTAECPGA